MEHGEIRNHRTETTTQNMPFKTSDGHPFTVTVLSEEHTVCERFCAVCDQWVTAKGIMGGLLCPECSTPWD